MVGQDVDRTERFWLDLRAVARRGVELVGEDWERGVVGFDAEMSLKMLAALGDFGESAAVALPDIDGREHPCRLRELVADTLLAHGQKT